ncbi:hypothetical protein CDL12_13077 [Handroanthus impetiginosus]|uniref:Uncharacterized protein n=1 Tax=Handroanthus impetiginosus TaxID=429701 RepID=A0A2G9H9V0_9LAMI|nr:hypothetical protein CDL12_13077 [Handroanthus impetiginosus]
MVQPEQTAGSEHPVYIKNKKMQQICRDPVTQNMHRVNNIQSIIEKRQPLRYANV